MVFRSTFKIAPMVVTLGLMMTTLAMAQLPPVTGAPSTSDTGSDMPAFLQPPPAELLQRGMQPLSESLPDTRIREGLLPPDASAGLFTTTWPTYDRGDQWTPITYHWVPTHNQYRPLFFEDVMLERHGQSRHPLMQPALSGTRFFASIAALPYNSVINRPCRPQSVLGHFRAGSRAPALLQRPPLQVDAGLFEAGLIVGLIFIVP